MVTRLRIALLLFFIPLLAGSCDRAAATERGLASLSEAERRQKFEDDLRLVQRYDEGLRATLAYARARPDLFVKSEEIELTPRQKSELRAIWQVVLDYMRGLDGVKGFWRDFHRFGALNERRAHVESFMVGHAAWLTQYRHGLDFIELTVPSRAMEKLLDERARAYDIPAGSFAALKWNIIHVKAVTRLLGSQQYWKTLEGALVDFDCPTRDWCAWGQQTIDGYYAGARETLKERAAIDFSYNAFDIARDVSFDAWFPVQSGVAEWMGDTRVRRLHEHLITAEQIRAMHAHLRPGDVIVARHNWYLSNVGLPGFWPHAALYVGSAEELAAFFDDETVKNHFMLAHGVPDLPTYLAGRFPEAWQRFRDPVDGQPARVVEALSEGVVFNALENTAGADYVGVVRPRRSKVDQALAIVRAFELWGRPYDFNFDFTTDDSLVCTEVVYKSWRATTAGLGVATAKVLGRVTLPANDIVRQFDEMCDAPDAPLEFVYFLDGREQEKMAIVATREDFRKSWQRPKWDTAQR